MAQFLYFGQRYLPDVGLIGMEPVIILVVLLSRVEHPERNDLRNHRTGVVLLGVDPPDGSRDFGFLGLCAVKRHRPVITSGIGTLSVERGGVMTGEERIEQVAVADNGRIIVNLYGFGVAGLVGADLLISWVG